MLVTRRYRSSVDLPASPAQINTVIPESMTCDKVGKNDRPPVWFGQPLFHVKRVISQLTITTGDELGVGRIRAFSISCLGADGLHHSRRLQIRQVCFRRERVILGASDVVDIKAGERLQGTLDGRAAHVVGVATGGIITSQSCALGKRWYALLLVGGDVCAILLRGDELLVRVVGGVVDVVLVLVGCAVRVSRSSAEGSL